jgi:hypothetical protein
MEEYPHYVNHSRKEIVALCDKAEKDIIAAFCYARFSREKWNLNDIIEFVPKTNAQSIIQVYIDNGYTYFGDRHTDSNNAN